jgi:hypothetical protein
MHQRPAQSNTPVDLLGQNHEAFVAEKRRLLPPRLRHRRHERQMIPCVQRDSFGHRPNIVLEAIEPGIHIVKTLLHDIFN